VISSFQVRYSFISSTLITLPSNRPDAVSLVDAFDIHDETLCSALGSYDGQAYKRLYESTLRDPMNKEEVSIVNLFRHLLHVYI